MALLVELGRLLAEVPDIPFLVLRVPVRRSLVQPAAKEQPVLDDDAGCAVDHLRSVRDRHDVACWLSVLDAYVDVSAPWDEREPLVVDVSRKAGFRALGSQSGSRAIRTQGVRQRNQQEHAEDRRAKC